MPLAGRGEATSAEQSIRFENLGAEAQKQYSGDGLSITPTAGGARLRAVFQRLEGEATNEGLWLASTADEDAARAERFRVLASGVGREPAVPVALAANGTVWATAEAVAFVRPGLVEEYRVSMDGIRQDFVLPQRPTGVGALRVHLTLRGATAEAAAYGAKLRLAGTGRDIAYSRLRVTDARGKNLAAVIEVPAPDRLTVRVDDAEAAYPVRIDPTFSDADWASMGDLPGANRRVSAVVVDGNGNLYIGGDFTAVGNVAANFIAKWNGSVWSPLGSGMGGENGLPAVTALAVSGGDLYAGGHFTSAGGVTANRIAKWSGNAWTPLGSGLSSFVTALAVSGGNLYAAGYFFTAGGVPANSVAMWNGTAWSALGSGIDQLSDVSALAVSGGDLYVGGGFAMAGGVAASHIAKWNGSVWSPLGSGLNGHVTSLAVKAGEVYAGGGFSTAGGISANNIAKWNGSAWSALGSGMNNSVMELQVSGGDLYAGGRFSTAGGLAANHLAKWNGTAWSAVGFQVPGNISAFAVSGSNLYVGGDFDVAGGVKAKHIAQWNGSAWSALGSGKGMTGEVYSVAVSDGGLYAGGAFTEAGGERVNCVARWDGNSWAALNFGMNGTVYALAVNGSSLYAGGVFTNAGPMGANRIAKWNGSNWSALGTGMNGDVYDLAVNGGDLYAGGVFTTAGGVTVNRIAKWNGSAWTALGSGMSGGASPNVSALAVNGGQLYAGGVFTSAGGVSASHIAKWNGSAWSALGSGMNGGVNALVVSGGNIYAGGVFSMAGGVSASRIAKWNGSAWSALGSGMNGSVNALGANNGDLYAGGGFTMAGGVEANRIAKWNGGQWLPLGSGMNSSVHALAISGSDLYAGGSFATAGGMQADYIVRADITEPPIYVTGNGVKIAEGDTTPATEDHTNFGGVPFEGDAAVIRTFTIINTGTVNLLLTGMPLVRLDGSGSFTVTQQPASAIVAANGGAQSFQIKFDPDTVGPVEATVTIASDHPDQGNYTFAIGGAGVRPEIGIVANGVEIANGDSTPAAADHTDFGGTGTGTGGATRTFTIANKGGEVLILTGAPRISLSGSAAFTVAQQPASATVAANGGTQTFQITFVPDSLGPALATVTIASNDPDHGTYTFAIGGTGLARGEVALDDASIQLDQGAEQAVVKVQRTGGTAPVGVTVKTSDGPASNVPPFASALAGVDYTAVNSVAQFAEGEMSKEVLITLLPKTGPSAPNKQFTVTLSAPTGGATLGAVSTATIQIRANDTTKPTVTITAPTAKASDLSPFLAKGMTGDAKGIDRVEVRLNASLLGNAMLGNTKSSTSIPWSLPISPLEGDNTLAVTAFDLRGNFTTVTRTFNFARRYQLTLSRTNALAGAVALSAKPAAGASALTPSAVAADPKAALVAPGTVVNLTAGAKSGFVFSDWQNLAAGAEVVGNAATFVMPANDVAVTAGFIASPFHPPAGRANSFIGLLHPTAPPPNNANVGILNGTLTASGGFTGKLLVDGVAQSINATFFGDGSAILKSGAVWGNSLTFGGRVLTLAFDFDAAAVTASLVNGASTSTGEATRPLYSSANSNQVPTALLGSPTASKGFYTLVFPAKEQQPPMDANPFPKGYGFATLSLTNSGEVSLTGTLADGAGITAGSALLAGDTAPFLVQLPTPAAASAKGGSLSGVLVFENLADSDLTAQELLWFRAAAAGTGAATHLYTGGWPHGIQVDALGGLYNSALKVHNALGLPAPDPVNGNAELMFTDGKLAPDITKTNFNISGNTVTKIPASDGSFMLTLAASTGGFSGSFVPNWANPNSAKPGFKGILLQKGANKGGYGFFISNAKNEQVPESGAVTLGAQK
jgi:hypothetical protein